MITLGAFGKLTVTINKAAKFTHQARVNDHHQRWWLEIMHLEGAMVLI